MNEIAGSIFNVTSARRNEPGLSPIQFAKAVAQGATRAEKLIGDVLRGEAWIGKERLGFGWRLISEINKRVLFYYPGVAGKIREDDEISAGGFVPARASQLPQLTYKLGTWLEDEVHTNLAVGYPKLEDGMRIATGAHYILTHLLHPFQGGNGRTARFLVNGILMYGTDELREPKVRLTVWPVPKMRQVPNDSKMAEKIERGEEVEEEPYIKAINDVERQGTLRPFELYIASIWASEVKGQLDLLKQTTGKRRYKSADFLRCVFESRLNSLQSYQARLLNGSIEDPIPNYDEIRYIRV